MGKKVTIIGAGLAGLACALDLHHAGWQTTVLEARSRVGGRVHTLRNFAGQQYAEAGGEFIEGFHYRMRHLVETFGLELEPLPGMNEWMEWVSLEGKNGEIEDVGLWGVDMVAELDKIWAALAELGTAVPDPTNPLIAPASRSLDQQSTGDWLETLPIHSLAKKAFIARIRAEYLAEPENHSLLDLARWGALYYNVKDSLLSYRIRGGNDQLTRAMANQLPDVRLGAVVTAVQQYPTGCSVTYQQNGEIHQITSDFVVLAIPLRPMQSISFTPPLPAPHQALLTGVSYGTVTKILIQYKRRFWHDFAWNGSLLTDLPISCVWQATTEQAGEAGILTVYAGAQAGSELSACRDDRRIETAVSQLDQLFPGSAQLVTATQTVAWLNEPFSQGGYASFAPGQVTAHWHTLRQSAGRIYFAGEHTAVHQGYMEGAVESGQRVASELQQVPMNK